jgi:hypothetical protein
VDVNYICEREFIMHVFKFPALELVVCCMCIFQFLG